jgi:hypothetical protein
MKLAHLPHVNESYAQLMREKLVELGSDKKETFF